MRKRYMRQPTQQQMRDVQHQALQMVGCVVKIKMEETMQGDGSRATATIWYACNTTTQWSVVGRWGATT